MPTSAQGERILDIPLSEIDDYPERPFRLRMDDAMQETIESVKQHGVLVPGILRPKDGRYQLIAGYRRMEASKLAENATMPCIVRNYTDDEAIIILVDSNLQRENILPSERAFAYKLRLEAMNRQGQRGDLTSVENQQKLRGKTSRQELSERINVSQDKIRAYIRLTELIPPILKMVDDDKIALRPAVEISYLTKEEQQSILDAMECGDCTPSLAQAIQLKKLSQLKMLKADVILNIMSQEKPNQREQVKIPQEHISRFFPAGASAKTIEATIIKALELYNKRQRDAQEK